MAYGTGGHSPADLPRYLEGMRFPASRMDLIQHARQHHADPEMIEKLEEIPDDQYQSLADVVETFSKH